ncbi:MAG: amidophosphoribosyltransferase [Cyanobacteria bacterium]|nr:amidophosphoribosyltransferase [Cyanobacteriota bacterium]
MDDKLKEKCAVFGVYGDNLDVSRLTFYGLFALQHRGQEASGIATTDGKEIYYHKDVGLVTHVYSEEDIKKLKGHIAVGHNLYSTTKVADCEHAQPVIRRNRRKRTEINFALVHNGNIPSLVALQEFLDDKGIEFAHLNDSELMATAINYYVNNGLSLADAVAAAYPLFTGVFSILVMDKENLVAIRDRCGVRPLSFGTIGDNGYVISSETCAFQTSGAEMLREIEPGEMVVINKDGVRSQQLADSDLKMDIFEFVYFSRPDSILLGKSVYEVRKNSGKILAREFPLDVDMVVAVPDTATPAAIGYSQALGIPVEWALVKNRYIHRTFIQPDQHTRDMGVRMKLNPLNAIIKGKRIALIDDSIVRGTTSKQIIKTLFEAGATEVHFLVSSPPVKYPDFYGIDTPKQDKLIAATKSVKEIEEYLGATSLYYLSIEGLLESTELAPSNFSTSCFTGDYPVDLLGRAEEVRVVS